MTVITQRPLRHREEVDAYLRERRSQAEAMRREIEAHSAQTGLRGRLLARLTRPPASWLGARGEAS